MAFIEINDLYGSIREEELDTITRNDDTIVNYGIDAAISEMKSYLIPTYDVNQIFSKTGKSRHALLLNFGIDIAIYIIVATALPGQNLEDRRARYKRSIDWLKQLKDGEVTSDLPITSVDSPKTKRGAYGEHNKRDNYF
jgi:phage gp36-like protein